MAVEKTVKINVDTNDAVKSVDKLKDSVEGLESQSKKVDGKNLGLMGKASGVAKKGVKSLSAGFKVLGGAIKAAGIGLIIAGFFALKEVLETNSKSAKFFKVAFESISIVMNDLINFVVNNFVPTFERVKKFFDNLTFDNIKKAIQENLVERIESAIAVVGLLKTAFDKFKNGDFGGALDSVGAAGKEMVDVMTGVNNVVDRSTQLIKDGVNAVTDYASETIKAAENNIKLANSAEIAAASQSLLIEEYDRQAEKQRQIRDNDLISIKERQAANDQLLEVLNKQEKAMLSEADAILASAQAQYNKNQSVENHVALIEAQANKAGVLAQIEGFRSEQEVNRIGLIKERLDLENSGAESEIARQQAKRDFEAEQIENEEERLAKIAENLELEREQEEERLQRKIDGYALDTQARLDAENELKDRLQEIDQEIVTNKKATDKAIADSEKKLAEERAAAQQKAVDATKSALNTAADLLGKNTAAGKAAAIAATTIDTIQSGVSAYKGMVAAIPGPIGIAAGAVAAAGSLASGYASVKKILSVKTPGGGGGGASAPSGGATAPSAPAFNLVGQSGVNQVQESVQEEATPIQAYVVGAQVTNQQELDRNQQDSASIG